jgi:hypothetical protein
MEIEDHSARLVVLRAYVGTLLDDQQVVPRRMLPGLDVVIPVLLVGMRTAVLTLALVGPARSGGERPRAIDSRVGLHAASEAIPVRTSRAKISGCSKAAKCPPRGAAW